MPSGYVVGTVTLAWFLLCGACYAQDLHISAQTLSTATTKSMFGRLPKAVTAAAVQICNETAVPQTVALGRISQQAKLSNGMTLLPRDAALSVIAASQGGTIGQRIFRGAVAATELAAIATGLSAVSLTVKAVLTSAAIAGGQTIAVLSQAIPTHTYLTFDHESLPDPLQVPATQCASGIVLVESDSTAKSLDFSMPLPAAQGTTK